MQVGSYEAGLKAQYRDARARLFPEKKVVAQNLRRDNVVTKFVRHDVLISKAQPNKAGAFRAQSIIRDVASRHMIFVAEMKGAGRYHKIVRARQEAMYRIRTELGYSFPHIARLLNRADHTTVMHGFKAHKKRLEAMQ